MTPNDLAAGIVDPGFILSCESAYHELTEMRTRCRCGRLAFAYPLPPGKGIHKIAVESGTFALKLDHDAEYPMVSLDGGAFELMEWVFGKPR